jgi:hypothetical protein
MFSATTATKYFTDEISVHLKGETKMDILAKIKGYASALADLGLTLIALCIVLEVLFKGTVVPFIGNTAVIANVTNIIAAIGSQGLVGLVAIWVLYGIWQKK